MTSKLGWVILLGAFLALPAVASAQEATISGTVTDATGGVLPGVTVTAVHEASGNVFVSVTNERGFFRIPLRTGLYRITAELAGFSTLTRTGLELLVGQQAVISLQIETSSLKETITVTGHAPLVDTTSSSLGSNVDPRQVSELPVNGRNWVDLTMLAPGSRANSVSETPTNRNANNSGAFQLNVDGQQVTQGQALDFGQPRLSKDVIAEFEFIANRFDATQGRSSGLQVNAITKSGTNVHSGSVSGYFRNDRFNAADFVAKRVLPYSDQQASVTFGGPIKKDRIHIFANYEYERQPQTFTYNSIYPRFNIDQTGINRYDTGGAKVDLQFSPQSRMSVRWNKFQSGIPYEPTTAGGSTRHPSAPERRDRYADQLFASFTQVLNARTVNVVKGGFANFGWFRTGNVRTPESILTPKGPAGASPRINLINYAIGPSNVNLPANLEPRSYSVRNDLTYSFEKKGRHDVKVGAEHLYNPDHIFIAFNGFGTLDAQGGPVPANIQDLFPVWNDVSTWNIAALTSISRQYTRGTGDFDTTTTRKVWGFWLQDDWAVNQRLTVNVGLRYDLQIGALAEQEVIEPFMPTPRKSDTNNLAPRLGFALTMNDRTVIRGGYGKFYAEVSDNFASFTKANLVQINATVLPDGRPDWAANPFNGPVPTFEQVQRTLCTVSTASNCIRRSISAMASPGMQIPYAHQASIGLQRQVGNTMAFTADYAYVRSLHEVTSQNINLSYNPTTGANFPFNTIALRPFPQWGTVTMTFTNGASSTHSLLTSFTKRFSHRWQASGTYTLSGLWDLYPQPWSGLAEVPFKVPADLGGEWGLAVTDQRHRAVFNGIWEAGWGFQLSGLYFFGSGERYATTWGGDPRATGGTGSRLRPDGTIVPRNNFVGKPVHRMDLRIQRRFPIGKKARLDWILETFNLFNHANYGTYSIQESVPSTYGQPVQNVNQAYLPRAAQLGFRFTF